MSNLKEKILKLYPWLFGFLALCLPFQTRYLVSVGFRETETVAIYAFDLILATLLIASLIFGSKKNWCLSGAWLIALWLFVATGMNVQIYWWLRVFEAVTLAYLIYQKKEAVVQPILIGFIFGMLASSIFGVMQLWTQAVVANKWLGIAAQFPWQSGVAVLETGAGRLLRAYGTFPHPNIFGGMIALAIIIFLSAWTWLPNWLKSRYVSLAIITVLFIGLWSSFSRSAWIGLIFGLAVLGYQKKNLVRFVWWILILTVLLNGIWYQFSFGRVLVNNRLEIQSLSERTVALETAMVIIRAHPWFGVGLGNFTATASKILINNDPRYIEPVHNVYLLLFGELGLVGVLIVVLFLMRVFRRLNNWIYPALGVIFVISFFDHYWWTNTSARLAMVLFLALALQHQENTRT